MNNKAKELYTAWQNKEVSELDLIRGWRDIIISLDSEIIKLKTENAELKESMMERVM